MPSRKKNAYYLNALGVCCCLGNDKEAIAQSLFSNGVTEQSLRRFLSHDTYYLHNEKGYYLGRIKGDLPSIPPEFHAYNSRNNQLLLLALEQIIEDVQRAIQHFGKERIAVILGSSTSGIAEGESALFSSMESGIFPENFHFQVQEIADGSEFLAAYLGLENMAVTISTACSSSAKVFEHAAQLIEAGICDAVITGGMDSLCHMTVQGFNSLGALSENPCNPFSQNRTGISIGEGGALFILSKQEGPVQLMSVGESSDAYSMTAPEPEGKGAEQSMRLALKDAGIAPDKVSYVNLHGTGTPHNDVMESKAVSRIFGDDIPCSSSKSIIGHTLGAAGAIETALCWLMLHPGFNPERKLLPHVWDNQPGDDITLNNFVKSGQQINADKADEIYIISNFCAFGGSNASILLKGSKAGKNAI